MNVMKAVLKVAAYIFIAGVAVGCFLGHQIWGAQV